MEAIYRWVQNITYYMIFTTVAINLLSSSKYEKYLRFFAGVVLILLVIQPLTGSLRLDERLAYLFESFSFRQDSADFEKRLWGMEEERLNRVIASYEHAVSLDLEAMARAEGYEPLQVQARIGKEQGSGDYGQVTAIYMRLGPGEERVLADVGNIGGNGENGPNGENGSTAESGTTVEMDQTQEFVPLQIHIQAGEEISVKAGEEIRVPDASQAAMESSMDLEQRAELNAFARKVAGYYGLKGTEVTVEWEDDKSQMDSAAVSGSGAYDPVLPNG